MNPRKAFEQVLAGKPKYKTHKDVAYFQDFKDAEEVKNELKRKYPEVDVVRYTRGWAVQYYKSGPYYPELAKTAMLADIPIDLHKVRSEELDKEILRLGIIAELDAVSLYEQMASGTQNKRVREVLLDVAKEEKTHVGEFQALLTELDPEYCLELEAGAKEVFGKEEVEKAMNPRTAFEKVLTAALGNKEYVIWGIPGKGVSGGGGSEELLMAKYGGKPITDKNLAKKLAGVLESEHGCKKVRIQEIAMSGEFDWMSDIGMKPRKAFEQILARYDMDKLHERIAKRLGWTKKETESLSLQALRDLVRPVDAKLAHEITRAIESGDYLTRR